MRKTSSVFDEQISLQKSVINIPIAILPQKPNFFPWIFFVHESYWVNFSALFGMSFLLDFLFGVLIWRSENK